MSTERPVDKGLIEQAVKALHGSTTWLIPEQAYGGAAYSNPTPFQHKTPDAERAFERKEALIPELQRLATSPHLSPTAKQAVEQALQTLMAAKTPADVARAVMMAELAATHGENAKTHGAESHQARMARLLGDMHEAAKAMDDHLREAFEFVDIPDKEKKLKKLAELEAEAAKDLSNKAAQDRYHRYEDNLLAEGYKAAKHLPPEQRAKAERALEKAEEFQNVRNQKEQAVELENKQQITLNAVDQQINDPKTPTFGEDVSHNDVTLKQVTHQPKSTGHERH
jgi:hypothetical protein